MAGITVSGIGEVIGSPDIVDLDAAVSVLANTVEEAVGTAAESARALIAALASGGVAQADISTVDFSIQPEYDYSGNDRRLTGYRVNNTVRARLRDVEGVGAAVDAVSAAGGDHARVNGLTFGIADPAALQASAREAAWNDAAARATQLALLSGRRLGTATSITEVMGSPVVPVRMMADMAMAKESGTPIQPGTTTVSVTLQVEFALGE
jgi:uncharacterized protein YggE